MVFGNDSYYGSSIKDFGNDIVVSFRAIAEIQEVFLSSNVREKNNIDSCLKISGITISPSHPNGTFLYFAIVRILSFHYTYKKLVWIPDRRFRE